MQDYPLNQQELAELRAAHRAARNVREAYRLNAVILLGSGWSPSEVAAALLINDDTVRTHFKRYKAGGIAASGSRSAAPLGGALVGGGPGCDCYACDGLLPNRPCSRTHHW